MDRLRRSHVICTSFRLQHESTDTELGGQVWLLPFPGLLGQLSGQTLQRRNATGVVLLTFDRPMSSEDATAEVAKQGLERPYYDDALYFGIKYSEAQLEAPVAFLHDPWLGNHGRRDAICLWSNEGRRELGLEGFDDLWPEHYRLAFVRPAGTDSG